ncbi:MAG: hypothetical protein H8E19_13245 [Deltaproteobacteria bacterium]|uniref:Uncharacterized protein n=1 Tax=Candidatus Desulfacyla euxinica TaxID=2841693 RepID=A0A8J6N1D8_9DELT|nr:hypothetical protein [Candidatus Desulfacyla euxinica]MBL7217561.1 hypothetical protein [Desulfobacteraceae bacterium]
MNQAKERQWQGKLEQRSNAVFLVRNILGCTCPEEIFDHYEVQHNVSEAIPMVQLIMGNRLLIWIVDAARVVEPGQILLRLLEQGLAERENRGLNRFRLVVAGASLSWEKEWAHLAEGLSPKVHLHILPDLRDLINNGEI